MSSETEEESMFVAVRLRPLNEKEKKRQDEECWKVLPEFDSIALKNSSSKRDTFTYDHIYGTDSKTSDIYDQMVDPIVNSVVEGVHGTVFAYGQTSCGKTYTMQGHGTTPGILQMAVLGIFEKIESCPDREFLFRVSYIEIYNEVVRDLLDPSCSVLKIRESRSRGVFVEAAERIVTDFSDITAALKFGEKQRHVEETKMNERSSRSHTIFKIILESKERSEDGGEEDGAVLVANLNLVDLAGSENVRVVVVVVVL
jgi:centromeric protein E